MDTTPENSIGELGGTNPASFIRTYAKDYAALSGNTVVPSLPTKKNKAFSKLSTKKSKEAATQDGSLITRPNDFQTETIDLAQIEHAGENSKNSLGSDRIPEEFGGEEEIIEPIALPRIDTGDIVSAHITSVAKPELEEQLIGATELPVANPFSDQGDSERAAILARLKAKAASHPTMIAPSPPVTEVTTPKQEPLAKSESLPKIEELPPMPLPMALPVIAPPTEKTAENKIVSESLHTYKTDFADHEKESGASKFTVLAAEKDAKRKPRAKTQKHGSGPVLAIISSIFLIIIGGGGAYAAYVYMVQSAPIAILSTPITPITPDASVPLKGTGDALLRALATQSLQQIPPNSIVNTYVTEATTTRQGVVEQQATGGAFFTELNLQAPDILVRNVNPDSMVGVVNAAGETRPFFVLRVSSYERTFAGMLTWESSMMRDLSLLFPRFSEQPAEQVVNTPLQATATSTSTANTAKTGPQPQTILPTNMPDQTQPMGQFVDEVVANHSARALMDGAGRTLLIYGYADKQTLLIARNEAAFTLLISRLHTATAN